VGIGFGIVFAIIVIVFLFTGLSLRPKREITIVCIILLILAGLDWFNVLNHCEFPFYAEECLDYPYEHHADVFPGLFPPLLFDEGCTDAHQKTLNPLGWECKPITWQVDEWHFCRANCTINPVSWVYAGMYWYVLACIIVHIPGFFRKKGFTL
jgi:hypothetical protein